MFVSSLLCGINPGDYQENNPLSPRQCQLQPEACLAFEERNYRRTFEQLKEEITKGEDQKEGGEGKIKRKRRKEEEKKRKREKEKRRKKKKKKEIKLRN